MKHYIVLIITAIVFTSCFEDPIELDLNEDNTKIVIEAWITDLHEPQYVTISYTANYLGNDPYIYEDNATVTLSDQSGNTYQLIARGNGQYYLPDDWVPQLGDLYEIIINVESGEHRATHLLRPAPSIVDLTFDQVLGGSDSLMGYETVFGFQETPGLGDAYYVVDYQLGSAFGDTLLNGGYADDEFFDGQFIDDIRVTEEDYLHQAGDSVIVELYSLGEETAKFLLDIELEVFRGGPFDPPPANVRSNFSGDALGYFIMSGADQQMIIIE